MTLLTWIKNPLELETRLLCGGLLVTDWRSYGLVTYRWIFSRTERMGSVPQFPFFEERRLRRQRKAQVEKKVKIKSAGIISRSCFIGTSGSGECQYVDH